jgi:hypothetical protein
MADHGNLADPDYEPTDAELRDLAKSAFAGVGTRNEQALNKLHEEISVQRALVMRRMAEKLSGEPAK